MEAQFPGKKDIGIRAYRIHQEFTRGTAGHCDFPHGSAQVTDHLNRRGVQFAFRSICQFPQCNGVCQFTNPAFTACRAGFRA